MTLFDQMQKRLGTTMVAVVLINLTIYAGLFIGALLVIKWFFF